MSKISFIKSDDREYNIERCLSLIKSEIMSGLRRAKNVVVKPNCVVDNNKLAATNVDALNAVLKFIRPYVKGQITIAEGVGIGDTLTAFKNYGYLDLQEKYDFEIADLNNDDFEIIKLFDKNGKTWDAQVSKTILSSDYLISVTPPKTHNEVVYTGAIKNVAVGSLLRPSAASLPALIAAKIGLIKNNKMSIHQGPKIINQNIKCLAQELPIQLAIIDGFEAMEGEGPINGDMVPAHWAIASSDSLAVDYLACQLLGIDIKDVGYLSTLDEEEEEKTDYFIIGDDWKKSISPIKMHSNFDKMKNWR